MNNSIFFSIIVPVYNVEKYIDNCIEHILNQTYSNFELIIVNDGSTDSCKDKCRLYAQSDERVVLIEQQNSGLLAARRVGLKSAKGDYVIHIDSDDYCSTELLETLNDYISKSEKDLVLYGYSVVDLNGQEIRKSGLDLIEGDNCSITREYLLKKMLKTTTFNNIWTKCAKRSIIDIEEDYSMYGRLMMGEDILQSLPLVENAQSIGYISEPLYMYRVNPQGMSRRIKKDYVFHYLMVRKRFYEALNTCGVSKETLSLFFTKYYHGLNTYLIKCSDVCSKQEYSDLINSISDKILYRRNKSLYKITFTDRILHFFCMHKMYSLINLVYKIFS